MKKQSSMLHNMAYYGEADLTQSSAQSLNEMDKANLNAKKNKKLKMKMKVPSSPIWTQNEAELTSLKDQVSASYACLKPVCIKKEFDTPRMEHSSDQKHSRKSPSNQVEQS